MTSESPPAPIRLLCDRCRAAGAPGDDHFASLGDLLDFAPVPRKQERVDGWTAQRQRAFIAALAVTGSPRRAAAAVGKAQWGAEQLRKADGADGFTAAWDGALAIAQEKGAHRLAAGINAVGAEDEDWAPAAGPWSDARGGRGGRGARGRGRRPHRPERELTPEQEAAARRSFLHDVLRIYMIKLQAERAARVAGRIAEADFYLRQASWFEIALDLTSGDGLHFLAEARIDGKFALGDLVETPMSRLLDQARREHWTRCGDPPRPVPPARPGLVDHGRYSRDESDALMGGPDAAERQRLLAERHKQQAREQVEWEAEARRDFEARRAASQPQSRETGSAGPPAPEGEGSDVTGFTPVTAPAEARRDYEARRAASQPIGEASAEDLPEAGRKAHEASAGQPRSSED